MIDHTSPSYRSVSLVTTLIIMIILICGVDLVFLNNFQRHTVEKIFSVMNERLLETDSAMIAHRIGMYLDTPAEASRLISHILEHEERIKSSDVEQELRSLFTVEFPHAQTVARISFAFADGTYTAFSRSEVDNSIHLIQSGTPDEQGLVTFNGDNEHTGVLHRNADYSVLTRPWFIRAINSNHAFWSDATSHSSFDNGEMMTWREPVRTKAGKFIGVISVDIPPARIDNWLKNMMKGTEGQVVLLDGQGHYIASSSSTTETVMNEIRIRHTDHVLTRNKSNIYPTQGHQLMLMRNVQDSSGLLNWTLAILTPDNPWSLLIQRYSFQSVMKISVIVFIGMMIFILVLLCFTRPLQKLISRVHLIGSDDWPRPGKYPFNEVNTLAQALDSKSLLINELFEDQRKQLELDNDTGLLTHAGIRKVLSNHAGRNMTAVIHLTNYSELINLLGPEYGHHLLIRFIEHLKTVMPPNILLARGKVNDLLILFPNAENESYNQWEIILNDIFISSVYPGPDKEPLLLTGKTAVVYESVNQESFDAIILNAGIALDAVRTQTNGAVSVFNSEMQNNGIHTLQLHKQLHLGLVQDEFYLVMQPIVSLTDHDVCTEGECLIRWENPTLGFVPPDKFISLAEKTGLIFKLGNWIVKRACHELADFIRRGAPDDFKLHINISPLQLTQPNFSVNLLSCIQQANLKGCNICVEITEGTMINKNMEVIKHLTVLRDAGVTVSLDDFGSGYSSLSYLHTLPFDQLKIDRQFVRDLLSSPRSEKVIASVLSLSKAFGVPLVAEGIEDDETGVRLQQMGCHLAQGYHYGRPQRFEKWNVSTGQLRL